MFLLSAQLPKDKDPDMDRVSTLVSEANALKVEIARLQSELANRTATLAAMVGHLPGKYASEAGPFTVSENNTYDEDAMRENLKPGQIARCEVRKFDKSIAKALYPAVYLAAKRQNGVKVTL